MGQPILIDGLQRPLLKNSHIELYQDANRTLATCELEGMDVAFFCWIIDDLDTRVKEIRSGIGLWQIDVSEWMDLRYRIQVNITLINEKQVKEQQLFTLLNENDFVQKTVGQVRNKEYFQDDTHNAVLSHLLSTDFSRWNVPLNDQGINAYEVTRWNTPNAPLYSITDTTLSSDIKDTSYFIRDALQYRIQGGVNEENPIVIGDEDVEQGRRNGLKILDSIVDSPFQKRFDKIVKEVNDQLAPADAIKLFVNMAHCDAIQLIPYNAEKGVRQYAGALMKHVHVAGNTIVSPRALQGIFASDGLFRDLHISYNTVQTEAKHTITINGMLSGKIFGNTDNTGALLGSDKIKLYPLRIGGGRNFMVLSFYNDPILTKEDEEHYEYEPITATQGIQDLRTKKTHFRGATHWKNVNLPALQKAFEEFVKDEKQLIIQMKSQGLKDEEIQNKVHHYNQLFMQRFGESVD